jgi:hypothetical protein
VIIKIAPNDQQNVFGRESLEIENPNRTFLMTCPANIDRAAGPRRLSLLPN